MRFTKMQGAGNDFIIINNLELDIPVERFSKIARKVCERRVSVGANALMVVDKAEKGGDFQMRFYNSDGSIGEMCGNGARCIARFAWENHIAGEHMTIETPAGIVHAWKIDKRTFKIRLNNPEVIKLDSPVAIQGVKYDCTYIELGNPGLPHAVVFLKYFERWDEKELFNLGKKIRNYHGFHKGANVNFCYVTGENEVKIKTFERGVEDFTLACGTGAGSTALAFVLRGLADGDKTIRLYAPGGILQVCIEFEGEETREDSGKTVKNLYLIGDTNIVATGEITDEDLSF